MNDISDLDFLLNEGQGWRRQGGRVTVIVLNLFGMFGKVVDFYFLLMCILTTLTNLNQSDIIFWVNKVTIQ